MRLFTVCVAFVLALACRADIEFVACTNNTVCNLRAEQVAQDFLAWTPMHELRHMVNETVVVCAFDCINETTWTVPRDANLAIEFQEFDTCPTHALKAKTLRIQESITSVVVVPLAASDSSHMGACARAHGVPRAMLSALLPHEGLVHELHTARIVRDHMITQINAQTNMMIKWRDDMLVLMLVIAAGTMVVAMVVFCVGICCVRKLKKA